MHLTATIAAAGEQWAEVMSNGDAPYLLVPVAIVAFLVWNVTRSSGGSRSRSTSTRGGGGFLMFAVIAAVVYFAFASGVV